MKNLIYFFDSRKYWNYCGFQSEKDFIYAMSLSVQSSKQLQRLKLFNLVLITDSRGIEILTKLRFLFNEIKLVNITDNTQYEIFNQNDSFINIDLNVIPISDFPVNIYKSQILVQQVNKDVPYTWNENFVENFKEFDKDIIFVDETYEKIRSFIFHAKKINTINVGILGGNDVTLLKKYSESIIMFKRMNRLNSDYDIFLKTVYTYYFFVVNNASIIPLIPKIEYGKHILPLSERIHYIQLSEHAKKNKLINKSIESILKNWYPNIYTKLQTQ